MAGASFSNDGAKRVARATVRVERSRIGDAPTGPYRGAGASQLGVLRAYVTTAIPTGTRTTPSTSGRVQIMHKEGDVWVDYGSPQAVSNDMTISASVPVGRVVRVAYMSGELWTVGGECY